MENKQNSTSDKLAITLFVLFAIGLLVWFFYENVNLFPEKDRKIFTFKIYYRSGRVAVKSYELPKSSKFSLLEGDKNSSASLWFHSHKPFGNEFGYLVFGVEDYKLISVK